MWSTGNIIFFVIRKGSGCNLSPNNCSCLLPPDKAITQSIMCVKNVKRSKFKCLCMTMFWLPAKLVIWALLPKWNTLLDYIHLHCSWLTSASLAMLQFVAIIHFWVHVKSTVVWEQWSIPSQAFAALPEALATWLCQSQPGFFCTQFDIFQRSAMYA